MIEESSILASKSLNICVFCAANDWPQKYTEDIEEFGHLLAGRGHGLISGGSNSGIMKLLANVVQAGGGKVVGVPFTSLVERVNKDVDKIVMTNSIAERKSVMLSLSDAIVVLIGGSGTLDETTEAIELKRHGLHNKPIVILNTDNFYDNLLLHYSRIQTDGLLAPHTVDDLVHFVDTPIEAIEYVEQFSVS
jgi:uncharacterized protein (TIGR00730 family)